MNSAQQISNQRLCPIPYNSISSRSSVNSFDLCSSLAQNDALLKNTAQLLNMEILPEDTWKNTVTGTPSSSPNIVFLKLNLLALYYVHKLQVYDSNTLTRCYELTFQDDGVLCPITCITECTFPNFVHNSHINPASYTSYPHTLLIGLKSGSDRGKIYLIDYLTSQTLIHFDVPFVPTCILTLWSNSKSKIPCQILRKTGESLLEKFSCPLVIGSVGGGVYILDLFFECATNPAHIAEEVVVSLMEFEPRIWYIQHQGKAHPFFDISRGFNDPTNRMEGVFDYLEPNGDEYVGSIKSSIKLPSEAISITSLAYFNLDESFCQNEKYEKQNPRTTNSENTKNNFDLIAIGYNFGSLTIWSLSRMTLIYCSSIGESNSPITHLGFQLKSVETNQNNCVQNKCEVLLWIGHGSIAKFYCNISTLPVLSCYKISFSTTEMASQMNLESIKNIHSKDLIGSHSWCTFGKVISMEFLDSPNVRSNNKILFLLYELSEGERREYKCFTFTPCEKKEIDSESFVEYNLPLEFHLGNPYLSSKISFVYINFPQPFLKDLGLSRFESIQPTFTFDLLVANDEQVVKLRFDNPAQYLIKFFLEKGPDVYQEAEKMINLVKASGFKIPKNDPNSLVPLSTEVLLDISLHNNLTPLITEYVIKRVPAIFGRFGETEIDSDDVSAEYLLSNPITVLNWTWSTFKKVEKYILQLITLLENYSKIPRGSNENSKLPFISNYCQLDSIPVITRDIYAVLNALFLRYIDQCNGTKEGQLALMEKLNIVLTNYNSLVCIIFLLKNLEIVQDYNISSSFPAKLMSIVTKNRKNTANHHKNSLLSRKKFFAHESPGNFLMIDYLIDQILVDSQAESDPSTCDSSEFLYPPATFVHFIKLFHHSSNLSLDQKHGIFYYLLLDLAHHLQGSFSPELCMNFANRVLLPKEHQSLMKSFWHLDNSDPKKCLDILLDFSVMKLLDKNLSMIILRKLHDMNARVEALRFLRANTICDRSVEASALKMLILLQNNLITEAFYMQRALPRNSKISYEDKFLKILLHHFYEFCDSKRQLEFVLKLPLDDFESDYLLSYLKQKKPQSNAHDIILIYLLQRNKLPEAITFYQETLKESIVSEKGLNNDETLEIAQIRRNLIEGYKKLLPKVLQNLTSSEKSYQRKPPESQISNDVADSEFIDDMKTPTKSYYKSQTLFETKREASRIIKIPASLGPALLSPEIQYESSKNIFKNFNPVMVVSTPYKNRRSDIQLNSNNVNYSNNNNNNNNNNELNDYSSLINTISNESIRQPSPLANSKSIFSEMDSKNFTPSSMRGKKSVENQIDLIDLDYSDEKSSDLEENEKFNNYDDELSMEDDNICYEDENESYLEISDKEEFTPNIIDEPSKKNPSSRRVFSDIDNKRELTIKKNELSVKKSVVLGLESDEENIEYQLSQDTNSQSEREDRSYHNEDNSHFESQNEEVSSERRRNVKKVESKDNRGIAKCESKGNDKIKKISDIDHIRESGDNDNDNDGNNNNNEVDHIDDNKEATINEDFLENTNIEDSIEEKSNSENSVVVNKRRRSNRIRAESIPPKDNNTTTGSRSSNRSKAVPRSQTSRKVANSEKEVKTHNSQKSTTRSMGGKSDEEETDACFNSSRSSVSTRSSRMSQNLTKKKYDFRASTLESEEISKSLSSQKSKPSSRVSLTTVRNRKASVNSGHISGIEPVEKEESSQFDSDTSHSSDSDDAHKVRRSLRLLNTPRTDYKKLIGIRSRTKPTSSTLLQDGSETPKHQTKQKNTRRI